MSQFSTGIPGVRTRRTAQARTVLLVGNSGVYLPNAGVVAGASSRDSGHTGDLDVLRCGLLLGRITSGGRFAPCILGISVDAYTAGGTTITVSAAQAVEIVRRVGATGNLRYVGPPTAGGVVATIATIAYSAVNTTTGAITTATLGVNLIAGGFVCSVDGSHVPVAIQGDEFGVKVTDVDGVSEDQPARLLVGGLLDSTQVINWPTDVSLRLFIQEQLRASGCVFGWDHIAVD